MKKYLIIGSNRGLGKEILQQILDKEEDCYIYCLNRTLSGLEHPNICEFICDLNNLDLKNLKKINKSVDYLILNSGVYSSQNLDDITLESIDEVINVNYFSYLKIIKSLISLNICSKRTKIINISTGFVKVVSPGLSLYSSSKMALYSLFFNMHFYEGYSVSNYILSLTKTEMGIGVYSLLPHSKFLSKFLFDCPENVAERIYFFKDSTQFDIYPTIRTKIIFLAQFFPTSLVLFFYKSGYKLAMLLKKIFEK